MINANAGNERVKHSYFTYLREAHGRDQATIDRVAASLARFENSTMARDFHRFHREQAVAFKNKLSSSVNARTGQKLSKATVHSTLRDVRSFILWLAQEPGYRSRIAFADAEYFNLSDKEVAIARTVRKSDPPTIDQMRRVLEAMPVATVLERRDHALVAFACLTGARASALASFRLGDIHLSQGFVNHDARYVRTKFAKTFRTDFHRVVPGAFDVFGKWCSELKGEHEWGPDEPLFPQADIGLDDDGGFTPIGIARKGWASSQPVRDVFKRAFLAAGLPYRNPHQMRDMLIHHYMSLPLTPAEFKAISQSLGHSDVLTTFTSYGQLPVHRQSELINGIQPTTRTSSDDPIGELKTLVARLRAGQRLGEPRL